MISRKAIDRIVLAVESTALITTCACAGTSSLPGQDILDLINEKRIAHGCNTVSGDDQLRAAAERHAVDIRDHPQHFGSPGTNPPLSDIHRGTDGTDGGARIAAAGYSPLLEWGEIIYWAPGAPGNTPQATVEWWMNSPDHRSQIETCSYKQAGVGVLYPNGIQWIAVVDFGRSSP